jgi:hypothetical protein
MESHLIIAIVTLSCHIGTGPAGGVAGLALLEGQALGPVLVDST